MPSILSHRLFRVYDWWEYKIPQILIPIYLVILNSDVTTPISFKIFIQIILGLVLGAITVSIIGEYFDLKQDTSAGKKNGFKNLNKTKTYGILTTTLTINILFCLFLNTASLFFYILSILTFVLYYIPFIRLKEQGFLGVIADSLGSHVFPCLFVFFLLIPVDFFLQLEYILFIFWVFMFGVRGILNHQYADLKNDIKSNTNTFVKTSSKRGKQILQKVLLPIEVFSFISLLVLTAPFSDAIIAFTIYLLLLFGRKMLFSNAIVYFNIREDRAFTIFLFEFYTIFFPLLLIIQIYPIHTSTFWGLFLFHILITLRKSTSILKIFKESLNYLLQ
ncbi:conserved membrane protein of unknown function [Tenacibaculum sp. 190130A14a]|uniref:4-hydroxybenzoate polyprenyltransferase n=1 Tax=Tenacibaculum polynesiense TaxID=3137857 RepID=A0ABM9PB54_9FLAO